MALHSVKLLYYIVLANDACWMCRMSHETSAMLQLVIRSLTLSETCYVNVDVNLRHYVIT
jgi:hypothetical protein